MILRSAAFCAILLASSLSASVWESSQNQGPHLQDVGPTLQDGFGFYIQADYLLLSPFCSHLDYAIHRQKPEGSDFPIGLGTGTMRFVEPDWSSGYRLAGGFVFEHGWDVSAVWSSYCSELSDTSTAPEGYSLKAVQWHPDTSAHPFVGPVLVPIGDLDDATYAHAQYELDHSSFDVLLATRLFLTRQMTLRPFLGGRFLWLDQKWRIKYSGGDFDGLDVETENDVQIAGDLEAHIHNDASYWGAGLYTGFDTNFHLGSGLSLFGKVAGSILAGENENSQWQYLYDRF